MSSHQEDNAFYNCLFLNKLPRELRILISEADVADKQALSARADSFVAQNSKLAHDLVAVVAAVSFQEQEEEDHKWCGMSQSNWQSEQRRQQPARCRQPMLIEEEAQTNGRRWQWSAGNAHCLACGAGQKPRMGSGLCFSHFCYGAKAKQCDPPPPLHTSNWSGK